MLKFNKILNSTSRLFKIKKYFSNDNFMISDNGIYIEQMYEKWLENRASVHSSWDAYFTNISNGLDSKDSYSPIPKGPINLGARSSNNVNINLHSKISNIIHRYRQDGHLFAEISPLKTTDGKVNLRRHLKDEINFDNLKINEAERSTHIKFNDISSGYHKTKNEWNAEEINEAYKNIYSGNISFEYNHIPSNEVKNWIIEKIEKIPHFEKTKEQKLDLLERIIKSQEFSKFCEKKFSNDKRFGIEGLDSSISGLNHLVNISGMNNIKHIIFGMAHRGRLNTLNCVLGMSNERIFAEMLDNMDKDSDSSVKNFSDDKYYHLPSSIKREFDNGNVMDVSLLPNPSHLETVNPLVLGKSRAKMEYLQVNNKDFKLNLDSSEKFIPAKKYVLPVVIHGDAAISGQGIVYECQQMSNLKGFRVGGTVHMVFNNQIGFTTDQRDGRSSLYSTEIGKVNNSFIIHVNASFPEYVDYAMELAFSYRQQFNTDVFIDIIGYRQYGHNEQDNAKLTQPNMNKEIDKLKKNPMYKQYYEKLISENIITKEEISAIEKKYQEDYEKSYNTAKTSWIKEEKKDSSTWKELLKRVNNKLEIHDTGFNSIDEMKKLSEKVFNIPKEYKPNSTINKTYLKWLESVNNGKGIKWSTAEHLAYAKLLEEGYGIRLVGEDVERGTFAHRHIGIVNTETNDKQFLMKNILLNDTNRTKLQVYNSLLSEYAVMGYEYGYSIANPNNLTIWEAQFGDFNNVAQPVIDQYIVSAEKKWKYYSGLTLLLPHGIDGLGPEHSSCRIERFLQLVDEDYLLDDLYEDRQKQVERVNIQICNVTKPANYFHLLRRQLFRNFRKPLIVASPKKLFTLGENVSNIDEFLVPNRFKRFYDEEFLDEVSSDLKNIKKVLVCSGQFYYDLLRQRRELKIQDTVIIRIEQIAPFTYTQFMDIIKNYPNSKVYYCQEEPLNSGAYEYLKPRINRCLKELNKEELIYIGRKALACPSEGTKKKHYSSLKELLKNAFN